MGEVAAHCYSLGTWFEDHGTACSLHCRITVLIHALTMFYYGGTKSLMEAVEMEKLYLKKINKIIFVINQGRSYLRQSTPSSFIKEEMHAGDLRFLYVMFAK